MSKDTKVWIIVAICLILIGYIIFCGVMNKLKWDFTKLSTNVFQINEYEINEDFVDINIITNTANIEFLPSENSNVLVVCNEQKNANHLVKIRDNILSIEVVDTRKWYEHIGINFNTPKITIYLPKSEYGELLINNSTGIINIPKNFKFRNMDISTSVGDIKNYSSVYENIKMNTNIGNILVEEATADMIELSTSTGEVEVINVNCQSDVKINVSTGKTNIIDTKFKNIISSGSTGNIYLKNVIASEKISIKRSTGDVHFEDCDANDIYVKTSTGNVKGNLLSDKVFLVRTHAGSIDVPKTVADGKCEINTSTGDIKITIIN